jgi:hypothetical protein
MNNQEFLQWLSMLNYVSYNISRELNGLICVDIRIGDFIDISARLDFIDKTELADYIKSFRDKP